VLFDDTDDACDCVQGFVKSQSMVEWSTSDAVPSRRSSRNFGVQRRAWHHLLRANPDEHDPLKVQQTSSLSSPGKQQPVQRIRLPKSNSMKTASDSLKSDVSSSSCKVALSQHAGTAQKGLVFDRKRSHRKFAADLVQSSKKPRHLCTLHPAKESSVSVVDPAIPSQSGVTYRFTENGLVHREHEPSPDLSFLSYR